MTVESSSGGDPEDLDSEPEPAEGRRLHDTGDHDGQDRPWRQADNSLTENRLAMWPMPSGAPHRRQVKHTNCAPRIQRNTHERERVLVPLPCQFFWLNMTEIYTKQRTARSHPGHGVVRATPPYKAVPSHDRNSGAHQLYPRKKTGRLHDLTHHEQSVILAYRMHPWRVHFYWR
jgi:hypothetical protein